MTKLATNLSATATAAWLGIAVSAVGAFEGLRTVAYRDPVGIPTVCFGETKDVQMGDTYTAAQCREMLGDRLKEFDADLTKCLPGLPRMPPPTRAAFVSWTYNVGTPTACKSTLVRHAKAGDLVRACNELPKWVYATKLGVKIKLPGLITRRAEERAMCLKGAIPT